MMGTLATLMAGHKIPTNRDRFRADVEADIEDVNGLLKITRIRVNYHLKAARDKAEQAREAMSVYLKHCPAAQSVIGCIDIQDRLEIEEVDR
jgi:organic hydroperoxide reductase OsmC/OhrA